MTLDASGNLLVGRTSLLTYSEKLTVDGAIGVNSNPIRFYNAGSFYSGIGSAAWAFGTGSATDFTVVSNNVLLFGAGGSERARITSGGYFKASNTGSYLSSTGAYHEFNSSAAAQDTLDVINSSATPYGQNIYFSGAAPNNSSQYFLYCQDTGAQRFTARSNGGLANYSGNNVNLSDRREKTNFAPAGDYLAKICAIPVQTFNYIDQNLEEDPGLTLGVVAQDVQAVAPELVMESNWAGKDEEPKMRLSIYQTDLQYALMKCIQEQQAIIEQLRADVETLKGAQA
jgi:hypothetical protein